MAPRALLLLPLIMLGLLAGCEDGPVGPATMHPDTFAVRVQAMPFAEAQAMLRAWIGTASSITASLHLPRTREALADARTWLKRARAARAAGERAAAREALRRATALLAATTPRALARRLAEQAKASLRARRDASGSRWGDPPAGVRRGTRLLGGVRDALRRGDYVRALRRAYYARQLLRPDTAGGAVSPGSG